MRPIKIIAVLFAVTAATVGTGLYGYWHGWQIESLDPSELSEELSPFYQKFKPDGTGPFPTVVGFHGCTGVLQGSIDWANFLVSKGYAVVLVDSLTHRKLDWPEVCGGKKLWGAERAGDILVSLQDVRELPYVDAKDLHLFGWSHGGWSVLDMLAILSKGQTPPNLSQIPQLQLDGVRSATIFYPYCGIPSRARSGWTQQLPVHFLFAENDSIVENEQCMPLVTQQQEAGFPVTAKTYPNVDHAFDMRAEDFYEGKPFTDIPTRNQSWNDVFAFLESAR